MRLPALLLLTFRLWFVPRDTLAILVGLCETGVNPEAPTCVEMYVHLGAVEYPERGQMSMSARALGRLLLSSRSSNERLLPSEWPISKRFRGSAVVAAGSSSPGVAPSSHCDGQSGSFHFWLC
ncbi:unnamed protein product [Ostreobium quekettii]|uniref:Secreted protein n=1 Tax=Ostreobium quekettii TaxID=121088 RepID=A0A8S1ISY5_9CHLO|nr:unnamed protein product [Ostreobium quekettii]|eukprot:evm.model.scf_2792.3 EVM.evm.TU.scf_2792.3   scf_2792:15517-17211(+)